MKKLLLLASIAFFIAIASTPRANAGQSPDNDTPQDTAASSTIDIIGWFSKCDTLIYQIEESVWKITDTDTIQSAGATTKAMINVVDSTASGYKMNYTVLDLRADSVDNSELAKFQNAIAQLVGKAIVGQTISFETDEYGKITKFDNTDEIKKQAKTIMTDVVNEIERQPWAKDLKNAGVDLTEYLNTINPDILIDGYLRNIQLLFAYHGKSFDLGTYTFNQEATESQYANQTSITAGVDDDDCYNIEIDVKSDIPQSDIKNMMAKIIDGLNDSDPKKSFDTNIDSAIKTNGTIDSYFTIDYLPNGWPLEVLSQETTMIGSRGKAKQTFMRLDSCSFYGQ